MDKLKKTNIDNKESINCSPILKGDCHDGPFFNQDFYGFVVVQTFEERNKIPVKLRQNGMIATVVEDSFSQWQLQTNSQTGVADNNNWIKISTGGEVFDGSNLFVFLSDAALEAYLRTTYPIQGQLIYSQESDKYFRVTSDRKTTDPFPNKLEKPVRYSTDDTLVYTVPTYINGQPYWRTSDDFGKVTTVNKIIADENKNIELGIDEILKSGVPKTEDTVNSVVSTKRVLLYDPKDNKAYWKKISDVGKISTVDNIEPIGGNIDLSTRYFTKTEIKNNFVGIPSKMSIDETYKVVLLEPTTNESFYIDLASIPKLKSYYSPDKTLTIEDDLIYLNVSNIKYETLISNYNQNMLPLDIQAEQEFAEITDVIVNGLIIPREMYRLTSKQSITLLENLTDLFVSVPQQLYITIKGIKFFK